MCQNWESILIQPSATMVETIEVIDKGALQLALVVDTENKLLGIVTDGDVRRALIRHQSMDCSIADVMHKTPLTAEFGPTGNTSQQNPSSSRTHTASHRTATEPNPISCVLASRLLKAPITICIGLIVHPVAITTKEKSLRQSVHEL